MCSNSSLMDMHKNTEVYLQLRWEEFSLFFQRWSIRSMWNPKYPSPQMTQTLEIIPPIFRRMVFDDRKITLGTKV